MEVGTFSMLIMGQRLLRLALISSRVATLGALSSTYIDSDPLSLPSLYYSNTFSVIFSLSTFLSLLTSLSR